jgi:hypothetical protein
MYFNSLFIIINDDESVAECVKEIRRNIFSGMSGENLSLLEQQKTY